MANDGKGSLSASILYDEIKSRLSGNLDYAPFNSSEKWIYKRHSVPVTPTVLFTVNDEYSANIAAGDSIATDDEVLWIAVKHSGYLNSTNAKTKEGIMISFTGTNPVYNGGTQVTGVIASAVDPTIFTRTSHGFVDDEIVRCTGFNEMTEINGLTGTVNQISADTFEINGIAADAAETTGGVVSYAGVSSIIAPGECYIAKLNGVLVQDIKVGTCVLTNGRPTAIGTSTVFAYVAAILDDV